MCLSKRTIPESRVSVYFLRTRISHMMTKVSHLRTKSADTGTNDVCEWAKSAGINRKGNWMLRGRSWHCFNFSARVNVNDNNIICEKVYVCFRSVRMCEEHQEQQSDAVAIDAKNRKSEITRHWWNESKRGKQTRNWPKLKVRVTSVLIWANS